MQKSAEQGGELPPALQNKPILTPVQQTYYSAFQSLSSSRQWTMGGAASIPFSEIAGYLNFYDVDEEDREDHIFYIQVLDSTYLEKVNKKVTK